MKIDFEALRQPAGPDGSDGPDLSDEPDFALFEADIEGFLPSKADDFYYAFRTANPEIETFADRCLKLVQRTRDLRLFVTLAKLAALAGEVRQVAGCLGLVRHALETRWDTIQPDAGSERHALRGAAVERLDEFASFVLPLQYAALVSDRHGHVSYRDHAVATGAVIPREEDARSTEAEIERVLNRCDMEALVAARDLAAGMTEDLSAIGRLWMQNAEDPPSLSFKRLAPMLEKMSVFLDEAVARRDPSRALAAAQAEEEEPAGEAGEAADADAAEAVQVGTITNLADAKAALEASSRYFARFEPSSPAFLLVRKAHGLVGLTFPQVLAQIAPDRVYATAIRLGGRRPLSLPMEKLSEEFASIEIDRGEDGEPSRVFEAPDRASAVALLGEVARWYRTSEPSNPIPLLLDRARELNSKDFNALLAELAVSED